MKRVFHYGDGQIPAHPESRSSSLDQAMNATGLGVPGGGQVGLKPTTTGMGRYLRILNQILKFLGLKPTTTGMGRYLRMNKIKIPFSGHWAGRPGQRPGGFETHHYGDGQVPA